MTTLAVSSVVDSILDAFVNGMDLLVRMRGRKQKRYEKPPRMSQEELRVHDSLQNRPKEIKAEYDQNIVKHGKRFTRGDDTAYSSLAHTLFVLNTGLINLINGALSSDAKDRSLSRQSLLMLSESAAAGTLHALSQLDLRLSISSPLVDKVVPKPDKQKQSTNARNDVVPARPAPSPLLQRGGWVRSKSGSSVVSAASAKKWAAQTNGHERSRSTPVLPTAACATTKLIELPGNSIPPRSQGHVCSCQSSPKLLTDKKWVVDEPESIYSSSKGAASMLLVPADYFTDHNIARAEVVPPPRPPKIPLHSRPNPRTRARPISAATFLTASTRIGEIPEHKWPDRDLPEEEQEELPLPYVIPPPLQPPKKKSRGLRFWKRPESRRIMTAY